MAHLPQLLLAALLVTLAEAGLTWGPVAPWAALLLLPLPHLIVLSGRNLAGRGAFRAGLVMATIGRFSGPLVFGVLLLGCGWLSWLRASTGASLDLEGWPEPALAWALLPFVAYEALSIDAQSRSAWPAGVERGRWRAFQLRMFATSLVPPGLFLGLALLVGSVPWLRVHVEQVQLAGAAFLCVLLVGLMVQLPALLTVSWRTHTLRDPELQTLFDRVSERAGFRARRVRIWETGNLVANAAIVGLLPSRREVLLSDSLVAQLEPEELASVFAHEVGHSRCNHVPTFLYWALAFLLAGHLLASAAAGAFPGADLVVFAGVFGAWLLAFGWLSRRFELQADLFAMRTIGSGRPLVMALEKVGGNLRDIGSWRHFGTGRRAAFLVRAQSDEGWARRFEERLRWIGHAGYAAFAVLALLQLALLVRALPVDRTWAALALGDYAAAERRLERLEQPEEALTDLVDRAATASKASAEEQLGRALVAAEAGAGEEARQWVALASLRGLREARHVSRVLDALDRDDLPVAMDGLWLLPTPWRALLGAELTQRLAGTSD